MATHPLAIWLLPGAAFACCVKRVTLKDLARAMLIILACLSLYAYLPMRSAIIKFEHLDPTSALAGIHGGLFWNYNDPSTWSGFVAEVTGSQFGAAGTILSLFHSGNLQAYVWNWLAMLDSTYGAFGIILAFVGLARLWSINWRLTSTLLLLALSVVPFSFAYANVEGDPERYRMLSLWLVPILMGGAASIRQSAFNQRNSLRASVVCVLMLVWASETLLNNRVLFEHRNNVGGRTLINEAASHIPTGSVVVTNWLDATSLAYGAYVDRSLEKRVIVAGWFTDYAPYYSSWLRNQRVYWLGNSVPSAISVRLLPAGQLDSAHQLWRVLPLAHAYRDQYTGRLIRP